MLSLVSISTKSQTLARVYNSIRSGYGFRQMCYSQTDSIAESLPLLTMSNDKCYTQTIGPFTGRLGGTSTSTGSAVFQAYPVILVNTSSTGLSTGAKIGIGVGVPAGVLILAAVVFIWWHRRRRARARVSEVVPPVVDEPYTGKPELDAGQEVSFPAPAELPTIQTSVQAELSAKKSPETPQAELPGDMGQLYSVQEETEEDQKINPGKEHQSTQGTAQDTHEKPPEN